MTGQADREVDQPPVPFGQKRGGSHSARWLKDPARPIRAARNPSEESMILVVDDDNDVRAMIARALQELGYPVSEAADGPAALAAIDAEAPSLVILDYMMPGMDGTEVAREIAARAPDLPIIFSTGHGALRALRNAAGDDASILEKPFALADLDALIEERLGKKRIA